jgi:hypothetical protein
VPRVVVVVYLCRCKGNLVLYDLDGCNRSIPNVDHALSYLGGTANYISTSRQNLIGNGRVDLS